MSSVPKAGWACPALVDALARAGWGVLDGRRGGAARSVLRALAQLLPSRSACGMVTANQVADVAGCTSKWARSTLGVLERAGIITWTRGGIVEGRPTPSLIRVSKRALVALIRDARGKHAKRLRGRAASFARRLADELTHRTIVRRSTTPRRQRRNGGRHAELSGTLPPLRGRVPGADAPRIQTVPRGSRLSKDYTPPPRRGPSRWEVCLAAIRKARACE